MKLCQRMDGRWAADGSDYCTVHNPRISISPNSLSARSDGDLDHSPHWIEVGQDGHEPVMFVLVGRMISTWDEDTIPARGEVLYSCSICAAAVPANSAWSKDAIELKVHTAWHLDSAAKDKH